MKRVLLATSVCVGLFAFTRVGTTHAQRVGYAYDSHDTTPKPKPDSPHLFVYDRFDTSGHKPDSGHALVFADTSGHKPDSSRLIVMK